MNDVTKDDVYSMYRVFLGREPESEAVVQRHLERNADRAGFASNVLKSSEFFRRNFRDLSRYIFGAAARNAPSDIQVDCSSSDLETLFDHVQSVWAMLGDERPHFSVLSNKIYSPNTVSENLSSFNESGRSEVNHLFGGLKSMGLAPNIEGRAVELGCGVGRVTRFLAEHFKETIGYDISDSHLKLARTYLNESQAQNCSLVHITDLKNFAVEPHDFFYSRIVLQHSPPPIMNYMLAKIMDVTRPGGIVVFQVPTAIEGYKFDVAEYLHGGKTNDQELHALPQSSVFRIMFAKGIVPVEVYRDTSVTGFDKTSTTFVGKKMS